MSATQQRRHLAPWPGLRDGLRDCVATGHKPISVPCCQNRAQHLAGQVCWPPRQGESGTGGREGAAQSLSSSQRPAEATGDRVPSTCTDLQLGEGPGEHKETSPATFSRVCSEQRPPTGGP